VVSANNVANAVESAAALATLRTRCLLVEQHAFAACEQACTYVRLVARCGLGNLFNPTYVPRSELTALLADEVSFCFKLGATLSVCLSTQPGLAVALQEAEAVSWLQR
jgi:hypothetical protein